MMWPDEEAQWVYRHKEGVINTLCPNVLTFDLSPWWWSWPSCWPLPLICLFVVIRYIPHVMTCLRVVMNRPERWSRSAGQQGAESCSITLYVGLSTCGVPPPSLRLPPLGPDQSINASQAAALLLRSPSASLHSAYTRLTGLISKLHPAPRLQGAAAAACEPSVEPDTGPTASVCLTDRHLPIQTHSRDWWCFTLIG